MRSDNERKRRDQIVRAALVTLAEHGISGTTLERIAQNAGMSRGHVRYFLGNRDQILLAAAVAFYRDPFIIPPEALTLGQAMDHLFGEEFARRDPDNKVVRAFVELSTSSDRIREVLASAYEESRTRLVALLETEMPPSPPGVLGVVAQGIMTIALGNVFLADFDDDPNRNGRAREAANRLVSGL